MCRGIAWEELDRVWSSDEPFPEGSEISEEDFDRILEGLGEEDDR